MERDILNDSDDDENNKIEEEDNKNKLNQMPNLVIEIPKRTRRTREQILKDEAFKLINKKTGEIKQKKILTEKQKEGLRMGREKMFKLREEKRLNKLNERVEIDQDLIKQKIEEKTNKLNENGIKQKNYYETIQKNRNNKNNAEYVLGVLEKLLSDEEQKTKKIKKEVKKKIIEKIENKKTDDDLEEIIYNHNNPYNKIVKSYKEIQQPPKNRFFFK